MLNLNKVVLGHFSQVTKYDKCPIKYISKRVEMLKFIMG